MLPNGLWVIIGIVVVVCAVAAIVVSKDDHY